ncbi:hypothetical protein [Paenibacillus tarimensis]|uniref:hypothetical protein n=1 Tax=Paenibacillus tarimensis TaxID=416012 RepID=UPI001F2B9311|nr:hypothetical protein [Paenibacillus tarimensis]MCF2944868.1 hypothetical protein [Paenibacillus tarimensis]
MGNQQAQECIHPVKLFQGEKWMLLTGVLGFILAGICAVWVMLYGGPVAPDGDVSKAISFNAALGIFLISTAAIAPLSGMGRRSLAVFRWSYIILALYGYFTETIQNFRGLNPRFTEGGTALDSFISLLFVIDALLLLLLYVCFAIPFFSGKAAKRRPLLVMAVRYAMAATMISFVAGIWLSVNEGRFTGTEGNIIWLHGFGFHALQAVPLVAWLGERSSLSEAARRLLVHWTGIAYTLGLLFIGWQTYLGEAVFSWSILSVLGALSFLAALLPLLMLLRSILQQPDKHAVRG